MNKLIVDTNYLLEKFPGKGGWTYVLIPEIQQNRENPFGWETVSGSIDGFILDHIKLMPFGNGQLFLPVKASIRKSIGKEAGDWVRIRLHKDLTPFSIPSEIQECFDNEPRALRDVFMALKESEQKAYIDWVYSAKSDEKKAERIVKMMKRLENGLRLYD